MGGGGAEARARARLTDVGARRCGRFDGVAECFSRRRGRLSRREPAAPRRRRRRRLGDSAFAAGERGRARGKARRAFSKSDRSPQRTRPSPLSPESEFGLLSSSRGLRPGRAVESMRLGERGAGRPRARAATRRSRAAAAVESAASRGGSSPGRFFFFRAHVRFRAIRITSVPAPLRSAPRRESVTLRECRRMGGFAGAARVSRRGRPRPRRASEAKGKDRVPPFGPNRGRRGGTITT